MASDPTDGHCVTFLEDELTLGLWYEEKLRANTETIWPSSDSSRARRKCTTTYTDSRQKLVVDVFLPSLPEP